MNMRHLTKIISLILLFTINCTPLAHAQALGAAIAGQVAAAIARGAGSETGNITYDGDCEITDENKKQIAQKGLESAKKAEAALNALNSFVDNDYHKEGGVCKYLDGTIQWLDEWGSTEANIDDHLVKGAKIADELLGNSECSTIVAKINKNVGNTDWDISRIKSAAMKTNADFKIVYDWVNGNHSPGDNIQLDDHTRDALEAVFGHKCSFIEVTENRNFQCYLTAGVSVGNYKIDVPNPFSDSGKIHAAQGSAMSKDTFLRKLTQNTNNACIEKIQKALDDRKSYINFRKEVKDTLGLLSGELNAKCTCGQENGEINCTVEDPDFDEDSLQKCNTVAEYQKELSDCLVCDLIATILIAVQNIANGSFDKLGTPMAELVGLGFLIFIAYTVLVTVANPQVQKISQLINTLLTQGFKVLIVVILLKNPTIIYDLAVTPILQGGIDLGLSLSGDSASKFSTSGAKYNIPAKEGDYLDSTVLKRVVGAIDQLSEDASMMPAIGRAMICHSIHDKNSTWYEDVYSAATLNVNELLEKSFPNMFMFFEGLIILCFGYALILVLGIYLLDCVLQMGIVCAFLPLFIASWPFKITNGYTKQGWNMLLNTFFNFTMTGVVIVTIVEMTKNAVSSGTDLQNELNNDMIAQIGADVGFGSLKMLIVIVCTFLCFKMITQMQKLANKFASGANLGIGQQILTTGTSIAMSGVELATEAIMKIIELIGVAISVGTMGADGGSSIAATQTLKEGAKQVFKAGAKATEKAAKEATQKITKKMAKKVAKQAVDSAMEAASNSGDEEEES